MSRQYCKGQGQLAVPDRPSSLVQCPECGRAGLGGEDPLSHDILPRDAFKNGESALAVPMHRESKSAKEWQSRQAQASNERSARAQEGPHMCRPDCPCCDGDDLDVWPQNGFLGR